MEDRHGFAYGAIATEWSFGLGGSLKATVTVRPLRPEVVGGSTRLQFRTGLLLVLGTVLQMYKEPMLPLFVFGV